MTRRTMTTPYERGSPTRLRFLAKKREARKARKDDAWFKAHSFWCKGRRSRHGVMAACQFEVVFREQVEGSKATCRLCKTTHFYSNAGTGRNRWLTMAEYQEVYIPDESLLRVEDVYREIDTEKRVKDKTGIVEMVPEKIIIIDHAPFCSKPDVQIAGLMATVGGPGQVRWTDSGGRFRHMCQSSDAAQRISLSRFK